MHAAGAERLGAGAAALTWIRTHRVFFAHQSVGANLLEGVTRLGSLAPALVESQSTRAIAPGTWRHARLGRNGAPLTKLRQLEELMHDGLGDEVDVVLFKLCYVDVEAHSDIDQLHGEIARLLARLRRRFRHAQFVPMTVPLTAVQGGLSGFARRLLGRPASGLEANARRHALNQRLRGEPWPLFDLARLEARDRLGRTVTFPLGAQQIPALAPENTRDGGHLVPEAGLRIARSLIDFLAGLR